ncbi:aspartyl protease family protein [Sphingomonas sp. RS6]
MPLTALILAAALQSGVTLAPDAEARWVPFDLTASNQIRFSATIGGTTVDAILDTGLTHTVVTDALARRAGFVRRGRERAIAIGGTVDVEWARPVSIAIGALSRRNPRIAIADLPGADRFGAELFVGNDLLGCCAIEIDYAARRFRILASGRLPFTGITVPLAVNGDTGVPTVAARLGAASVQPMLVDTGDGSAVTVARPTWVQAGERGAVLTTTLGWGMGGGVVTDTAIVTDFSVGAAAPRESEVRIEDAGSYSLATGLAGRIGNGWLMRYHLLIDPRAGRLVLAPGADVDAPVPRSTSGLLLAWRPGRFEVLHVMRGSPADAGGWRRGDAICAEAGVPVPVDGVPGQLATWTAGTPGRRVELTLCDGTRRTLTLRRFY